MTSWACLLGALLLLGASVARAADPPTPQAIELARQVLRSDGSADALAASIGAKRGADIKQVAKSFAMNDARATLFVDKYLIPEMRGRLQEALDGGAEIYAARMSVADLQALVDFLRSPPGQKFAVTRAEIAKELTNGERAWQHAVLVDAMKKFSQDQSAANAQ